ncbi:sulfurtransferase [Natronohydrobacter thiooxidans]|uniref:sulfurtransferase n=1 Tax=Natronohydrobacter thiooxidans TaxID=87172 RepID=UPI0008FF679A|nr:rhodanese-like domain-containing protein [Natronohydrobacter thiooxidans]
MLRNTALTLSLIALPSLALATPQGWSPLLEPAELAAILEADPSVRVIHVSGDFAAGHIPGAAFSPYEKWRGGPSNPGALLPELEYELEAARVGVDEDTPVVLVHSGADQTDMGTAARVYWTLKSLGVQDLALLNGGFAAWQEAQLPVSTTPTEIAESGFMAEWTDEWYISTSEVAELAASGEARLLDSRPKGFFEGITWSIARPGTVRGAENLEYSDFFEGTRLVSPERAREIAEAKGLIDAPITVSFCNTGHWAALNWFALSELAGIENTRLYAESMAEYSIHGHETDNEPGRIAYLWRSTLRWVEGLF